MTQSPESPEIPEIVPADLAKAQAPEVVDVAETAKVVEATNAANAVNATDASGVTALPNAADLTKQSSKVKSAKPTRSARRRAREFALQSIYEWRVGQSDEAAIEVNIASLEGFSKADNAFLNQLVRGILKKHALLEDKIQPYLDRPFKELSPVEAGVLLIGCIELVDHLETPYRVVINEAIELAKTFGGTDGHKYVNGVLDKLALELRQVEIAARRS